MYSYVWPVAVVLFSVVGHDGGLRWKGAMMHGREEGELVIGCPEFKAPTGYNGD